MNETRLTVGQIKDHCYRLVNPSNRDGSELTQLINQCLERFHGSGKWKGSVFRAVLNVPESGIVTLPRRAETLLGFQWNRVPLPVYHLWHEFLDNGPGDMSEGAMLAAAVDLGDGFCTFADPEDAGTVRLTPLSVLPEGEDYTATVHGLDADGKPVYNDGGTEGEGIDLAEPYASGELEFQTYTRVILPVLPFALEMYHCVDGEDPELVGSFEPGETAPCYRRYRVVGPQGDQITALLRRRCVSISADSDLVIPGHLGAFKLGLMALRYEEESDQERADANWAKAYGLLNDQLREARGFARSSLNVSPHGFSLGGIPNLR